MLKSISVGAGAPLTEISRVSGGNSGTPCALDSHGNISPMGSASHFMNSFIATPVLRSCTPQLRGVIALVMGDFSNFCNVAFASSSPAKEVPDFTAINKLSRARSVAPESDCAHAEVIPGQRCVRALGYHFFEHCHRSGRLAAFIEHPAVVSRKDGLLEFAKRKLSCLARSRLAASLR